MDHLTVLTVAIAALATALATTFGLLPDRVDLMFVFAAYGAGSLVGQLIAHRRERNAAELGRRWGLTFMSLAACVLLLGLLGAIPS